MLAVLVTVAAAAAEPLHPADAASASVGIYSGSEVPSVKAVHDSRSAEVGVEFSVTKPGFVIAIRYYKSSSNTGTHTGSLWTASGRRLATVTFTSGRSTGWQRANLKSPVALTPGVTYIASYHTNTGHYAENTTAFANGATLGNSTMRAIAGVYRFGRSAFPNQKSNQTAYYVDALFVANTRRSGPTSSSSSSSSVADPPTVVSSTASSSASTLPSTSASTSIPPTTSSVPAPPVPPKAPPTTVGGGPVPAACNSGGSYLWSNLATCGWPSASNTGPVLSDCPGGQLTINSGAATRTIKITAANTVISCQNITGCLLIEAQNVTIENVQIACTSGKTGQAANGTGVIFIDDGASATINHVLINGMDGVHACIWHQGTAMTANAVNCSGINDGIFSWADTGYSQTTGDHFTIENSYFHDFTVKTANGHIDGYQTEGAANGVINHNTYYMTSDGGNNSTDSAIAVWDSLKSSSNIAVSNNLIAGGGFSIYAEDYSPSEGSPAGGYSLTNVVFTNNKFSTALFGCVGLFGVWYTRGAPTDAWHRSGNTVLETGASLDGGNPSYHGNSCT